MKKFLLFSAAIFCFTSSFAQSHVYVAFGYDLGYAKLGGLNYVVDQYNNTRDPNVLPSSGWQSFSRMNKFSFPNGFCTSVGGSSGKLMFDVTWLGRHMTRSAGGVQPNGNEGRRELKWRMNTLNLGMGVALGQSPKARVSIGITIDMGNEKIFTRTSLNGVFNPEEFQPIQKEFIVGTSLFMQFILSTENLPGGLFIRPYVQLPYLKTNYWDTNLTINSATADFDRDYYETETKSWNVGVQLMLGLFLRDMD